MGEMTPEERAVKLVSDRELSWHQCGIAITQAIREAEAPLREVITALVGELQRLQPNGSPPPGGPIMLAKWIVDTQIADNKRLTRERDAAQAWRESAQQYIDKQSAEILEVAAAAANLEVERNAANERTEVLEAGLQAIEKYEPPQFDWPKEEWEKHTPETCAECRYWRDLKHPLQHSCDGWYRLLREREKRNTDAHADSGRVMQNIARETLSGDNSALEAALEKAREEGRQEARSKWKTTRDAERDALAAKCERLREALNDVWAAIGDRLLAEGPLSVPYAHNVQSVALRALAAQEPPNG